MNELKRQELIAKGISINDALFLTKLYTRTTLVDAFTTFTFNMPKGFSSRLIDRFESFSSPLYPVGKQGLSDVSNKEDIGSYRKTVYDESLAKWLSNFLIPMLPTSVITNDFSPVQTDVIDKTQTWSIDCISPLFRYMRYEKDGSHNPHYDAPYVIDENTRTLFSGILYLTTNEVYTRLINDDQMRLPFTSRKTVDWAEPLTPDTSVYNAKRSEVDTCFIFPHGVCHDVSENTQDSTRIIIRFDVQGTKI